LLNGLTLVSKTRLQHVHNLMGTIHCPDEGKFSYNLFSLQKSISMSLIVLQVSNQANILVCSLSLMEKCQNDSWQVIVLFGNYTACTRTVLLLHIADSNCDRLYCHTSTLSTGAATGLMAHPHYVTTFLVFMIYCRTLLNFCSYRYTSIFRKWGYISLPSAALVWSLASFTNIYMSVLDLERMNVPDFCDLLRWL